METCLKEVDDEWLADELDIKVEPVDPPTPPPAPPAAVTHHSLHQDIKEELTIEVEIVDIKVEPVDPPSPPLAPPAAVTHHSLHQCPTNIPERRRPVVPRRPAPPSISQRTRRMASKSHQTPEWTPTTSPERKKRGLSKVQPAGMMSPSADHPQMRERFSPVPIGSAAAAATERYAGPMLEFVGIKEEQTSDVDTYLEEDDSYPDRQDPERSTQRDQGISDELDQLSRSAVKTQASSESRAKIDPTPDETAEILEGKPDTLTIPQHTFTRGFKAISKKAREKHEVEPYKCDMCDFRSAYKSSINRHVQTRHTDEKPHKCNLCDFKTALRFLLITHLRTHTGEKPYKCNWCDYKCSEASALTVHHRTHTGEKPYKCNLCDYKSATISVLHCHIRQHTGEKPFKCNLCNYKTSRSTGLKLHARVHTGEKPYKCKLCDYKSAFGSGLRVHSARHH